MENNMLIKKEKGYVLINEVQPIASTLSPNRGSKLSLKNCQEIELGYDLDELAEKHFGSFGIGLERAMCYKAGFKKALEILGDKKFSEEDMREAIDMSRQGIVVIRISEWETEKEFEYNDTQIIQSLQQTKWDVIVEMEEVSDGLDEKAQHQYSKQPKLDADGCLILKRKCNETY